jgi:hypothetical protein
MSPAPAFYNPIVLDHFLNPRNVGEVPQAEALGEAGEPSCGDTLRLSLRIKDGPVPNPGLRGGHRQFQHGDRIAHRPDGGGGAAFFQ